MKIFNWRFFVDKIKQIKEWYWVAAGALVLGAVVGGMFYQSRLSPGSAVELDWQLLGEGDYITNTYPDSLKELDGKEVRIPGFMVPLEDNMRSLSEFLLVPSPQACVHVPSPPPNQMVYVKAAKDEDFKMFNGPVWIQGKLKLTPMKSMYGEAYYNLIATEIEPYR
jgi:hypothetical protein